MKRLSVVRFSDNGIFPVGKGWGVEGKNLHPSTLAGGGGVLPEKLGGGVRPASQNPYPIYAKICDILYPIYDLTKNSKPYPVSDLHYN